jgi:hypothetical protein
MVEANMSSEKVAFMLTVGATALALALGEVFMTLGGVVSLLGGAASRSGWWPGRSGSALRVASPKRSARKCVECAARFTNCYAKLKDGQF